MERSLFSSESFGGFAKKVELFCHIESRIQGAKYPNLLKEKGGSGYPHVCFLDAAGDVIALPRRDLLAEQGVEALEATLASEVKRFADLKRKAAKGDKAARAEFFMLRFDLGHLDSAALSQALAAKFLDDDQRALVQERLISMRVDETLKGLDQDKPETFGPYAKKLLAQHAGIGLPEGPAGFTAWYVVLEDAYLRKDPKTFKLAFVAMQAAGARHPTFVDKQKKRLAEIAKDQQN